MARNQAWAIIVLAVNSTWATELKAASIRSRLPNTSGSKIEFFRFPVDICNKRSGVPLTTWEVTKSASLLTTARPSESARRVMNVSLLRFVRQIQRVNGIVPGGSQCNCQLERQLCVNNEFHAASSSTWLVWVKRAA